MRVKRPPPLSLRVPPELTRAASRKAANRGLTRSAYIRALIERDLAGAERDRDADAGNAPTAA